MSTDLHLAVANSATARAHLAGAEAAELERRAQAARRQYWREVSAAATLTGIPWPEAEALGVEP